jgi:hypothetical protein
MRHNSLTLGTPTVAILLIFALVVVLAILKRRNRFAAGSMPWPFYVKRRLVSGLKLEWLFQTPTS